MGFRGASLALLVGKDLLLEWPSRIVYTSAAGGRAVSGAWAERGRARVSCVTDHSFLPCSGRRTAASSWTAALPSPEGEPPHSR